MVTTKVSFKDENRPERAISARMHLASFWSPSIANHFVAWEVRRLKRALDDPAVMLLMISLKNLTSLWSCPSPGVHWQSWSFNMNSSFSTLAPGSFRASFPSSNETDAAKQRRIIEGLHGLILFKEKENKNSGSKLFNFPSVSILLLLPSRFTKKF